MITSFSNPTVKFIRKLDQKKFRQESGVFFIEGLRTVGEAIQTGAPIKTLVISPELLVSDFGKSLLNNNAVGAIERIELSSEIYKKIAHKEGPQGIGAIIHQNWSALDDVQVNPGDIWVALDAISDPGNLGTIMRTTEAIQGRGIILLENSTDPHDPSAVKASMGAIFSLVLIQASWEHLSDWRDKNKLSLVGTSDRALADYQGIAYQRPLILLMGSERHGLSPEMMAACDLTVRIPMAGRSDSLNLAVATALMLYEIYNQSRKVDIIKP